MVFASHLKRHAVPDAFLGELKRLCDVELQFLLHELTAGERFGNLEKELVAVHLRANVLVSGAGHEVSENAPPSHRVRST